MGQTQTATIIQQEALHSVSLNPHWRVVRDAEEINSCLSIAPLLDQLSFDLSNSNWTSSITINPLSYDPITMQMQNREQEIKEQSRIVYKMESQKVVPNQRKLRTAQTQTEQDPYQPQKNDSLGQKPNIKKTEQGKQIPSPKMIRDYSEQPNLHYHQMEIRREKSSDQYKQKIVQQNQNPYKLQNEVTENFSNDDESVSMSSITQNFEALKYGLQQYDDRSFIQNQRFWSSDHSSFLIDIPSQVMQKAQTQGSFKPPPVSQPPTPDQFTQAQRRLTQQQSFGQKQNQFQCFQQHGQSSPTQKQSLFQQQDAMKKTQPLNQQMQITQSVPVEQQQQKQATQNYYSDKKQQSQQASKSPTLQNPNFNPNERNLPNSPKTQTYTQGSKESMRQQFDRLLRESQQKKMAIMKPNGKPVTSLKSSDSDQDLLIQKHNTQKQTSKKQLQAKLDTKCSPHKSGKSTYQQPTSYAERNKLKQKMNQSPPTSLQNLKQARNELQKQKQGNQQNNAQLQKLNEKIEWISRMNQEQEQGEEVFRQIKNNVSNLKTAITQNISPSERGDKNSNTNRFSNREDEINLDNLPDFQEGSINLDRLSSYRESIEKQQRERQTYD